jgi:GT2 family glycosyltransferase
MSMPATPDVSVVIVSFNTRDLLHDCLQTLYRESGGATFETILIDNGSRDGSADMVEADFPAVRLVRSQTNLGFAAANNRGFAIATGRYIVLLNSDAFVYPGVLQRSVEHMDRHPQVGLAGARLMGRDGSWQPSARLFPSCLNELLTISGLSSRFPKSRFFGRVDQTCVDPLVPIPIDWVPGAYCVIRRDLLELIGYFDERFFLYYEEVDLCRRIKAAGYEVWYWPDLSVVHLGGESSKTMIQLQLSSSGTQITLWRMRSRLLYYRKHHGALGAWSAMAIENCWTWLRLLRNSISRSEHRRNHVRYLRATIAIMKEAWADTQGGALSPPPPW